MRNPGFAKPSRKRRWLTTNLSNRYCRGFSGSNPYLKVASIALLLLLLASAGAHAQSFLASVSGIVSDPTGAVAPGVKVTVTDTARGVPFTTTTNQDGVSVVNNLIPSTYKVTAES